MRVFLGNTDHLSDRELYRHLWEETLHEHVDPPFDRDRHLPQPTELREPPEPRDSEIECATEERR